MIEFPPTLIYRGTTAASWVTYRSKTMWLVQRHANKPECFLSPFTKIRTGAARPLSSADTVQRSVFLCETVCIDTSGYWSERGTKMCSFYYFCCVTTTSRNILQALGWACVFWSSAIISSLTDRSVIYNIRFSRTLPLSVSEEFFCHVFPLSSVESLSLKPFFLYKSLPTSKLKCTFIVEICQARVCTCVPAWSPKCTPREIWRESCTHIDSSAWHNLNMVNKSWGVREETQAVGELEEEELNPLLEMKTGRPVCVCVCVFRWCVHWRCQLPPLELYLQRFKAFLQSTF